MALVTISGFPSAGKTTRALQLVSHFQSCITPGDDTCITRAPKKVVYICDHGLENPSPARGIGKDSTSINNAKVKWIALSSPRSSYTTAKDEKQARGHLFATAQRHLDTDTVVVLDGPNYIKGFRYQLHCEAKNLRLRSCVVHVAAKEDDARQRNEARLRNTQTGANSGQSMTTGGSAQADPYDEGLWEDLIRRYEEPNAMARWDKPLFTVVSGEEEEPNWEDRVWREGVCGEGAGSGKGASDGGGAGVRPNAAAVVPPPTDPNHLHALDRITQDMLFLIHTDQQQHHEDPGGDRFINTAQLLDGSARSNGLKDSGSSDDLILHLPDRVLPSMQLQRLRRQFIALNRQQMGGMGMGAIGKGGIAAGRAASEADKDQQSSSKSLPTGRIAELFAAWLNDSFERG
ncbi:MAG: hypothetical protein M1828_000760 [Chrysothrix sp. TS-e1954]|nr:MAG: hypothetical protein M1828_000760 [Chrysothrix sp. TS-e1954]